MDVVNLPRGEGADEAADCIKIVARPDGRFDLEGSLLMACGDSDEVESVAIVAGEPYATEEAATDAGIAWASGHCVERLYVSRLG